MPQQEQQRTQVTQRVARWLDERAALGPMLRSWRRRVFPDHWSVLLGHAVVASFAVCMLSGIFLMFFYDPSAARVTYSGSYAPLAGVQMSRAFESTLNISLGMRGGLLMRQLHQWSASLMIAALTLHILRIFFTAGFRKPRELNWVLLLGLLGVSLAEGLTGQILPDDLVSGSSLAVLNGVLEAIPLVGTWLSALLFGGAYPSGAIATFYPLHVFAVPAVLVGILLVLALLNAIHGPTQFSGPGRSERRVVGLPLRVAVVKRVGFFFIVAAVLTLIAATVTANPIWNYGPSDPGNASAGDGALWYVGFLDGALRLVPPGWEITAAGRTLSLAVLLPAAACALFLLAATVYPFFEGWLTGDRREHRMLTRPRNAPTRTGLGVAGMVFYGVLWAAAGSDSIATHFSLSVEGVVAALQLAVLIGPVLAFAVTRRICFGLQRKDRMIVLHGYETGRVVRLPGGRYVEVHEQLDVYDRWRLIDSEGYAPAVLRPGSSGRIRWTARARAVLSRWYFQDRILPLAQTDLDRLENTTRRDINGTGRQDPPGA